MRRQILLRDRLAYTLANLALRMASPWYISMIRGSIKLGMTTAALPAPPVNETELYRQALQRVRERYPEDIFPPGPIPEEIPVHRDVLAARMARLIVAQIERDVDEARQDALNA